MRCYCHGHRLRTPDSQRYTRYPAITQARMPPCNYASDHLRRADAVIKVAKLPHAAPQHSPRMGCQPSTMQKVFSFITTSRIDPLFLQSALKYLSDEKVA
eukprot:TRINITY_DN10459_c0_g1_i1.p4 TRINITY_DN10459_c0_g1~~TRINITY_DN10459_c0_g1_i1.p4  ORF type:complete len:100 (-),score=6.92 TRINITY_DN10459_c0_g1_i1:2214-2513(-)